MLYVREPLVRSVSRGAAAFMARLERVERLAGEVVELHGPSCPLVEDPRYVPSGTIQDLDPNLWRAPRVSDSVLTLRDVRIQTVLESDGGPSIASGQIRSHRGRRFDSDATFLGHRSTIERELRSSKRVTPGDIVAVLDVRARAASFGHWLIDALPNIWLFEQAGLGTPTHYLFPAAGSWQRETLRLAGVPPEKDLTFDQFEELDAAEVWLPLRSFGSRHVPTWIAQALRAGAGEGSHSVRPDPGLPRRIYVGRSKSTRRGVENEDALVTRLEAEGFTAIDLSALSLLEQRRHFASARTIVAPHGAALTNLAWATPGAQVVELLSPHRVNALFYHLARQSGLDYVGVIGRVVEKYGDPGNEHSNFTVVIHDVLRALHPDQE
jgi:hypothetical protein